MCSWSQECAGSRCQSSPPILGIRESHASLTRMTGTRQVSKGHYAWKQAEKQANGVLTSGSASTTAQHGVQLQVGQHEMRSFERLQAVSGCHMTWYAGLLSLKGQALFESQCAISIKIAQRNGVSQAGLCCRAGLRAIQNRPWSG